MKAIAIVLGVTTALVTLLSQSTSQAATRARTPAETVFLDSAPRIALGGGHTCQVNADGTARCWGDNESSQFFSNTFTTQLTPVPVVTDTSLSHVSLTGVVAVSANNNSTCFLIVGGIVRCQGGLSTIVTSLTTAVAIAAGSIHS